MKITLFSARSLRLCSRGLECCSIAHSASMRAPLGGTRAANMSTQSRTYLENWLGVRRDSGTENETTTHQRHQSTAIPQRQRIVRASPPVVSPPKASTPVKNIVGRSYLVPTLKLERGDTPQSLAAALRLKVMVSPNFFRNSPVILDMAGVSLDGTPYTRPMEAGTFADFLKVIKDLNFIVCGLANASEDLKQLGVKHGIPSIMTTSMSSFDYANGSSSNSRQSENVGNQVSTRDQAHTTLPTQPTSDNRNTRTESNNKAEGSKVHCEATEKIEKGGRVQEKQEVPEKVPPSEIVLPVPKVLETSVRTGQQVYAQGTSLVIMGSVNSGAEVLADGDIHIYGKLMGRALAGVSGNKNAKIFARVFDAELVSIGDIYSTIEPTDANCNFTTGQPTFVFAENGELKFKSLSTQAVNGTR